MYSNHSIQNTLPTVRLRWIPRSRVHVPPRVPAVPSLERNLPRRLRLIGIRRAQYRIRGNALLNPPHHSRQHIALRV